MLGTYFALVRQVMPHAIAGLIAGSLITGPALSALAFFQAPSFTNFVVGWSIGMFVGVAALGLGCVVAVLYGAPAYALLVLTGRNTLITALLVGLAPGAVLLAFGSFAAVPYLVFGSVVGGCTHLLYRRHRPNNSSKPTPLRGAA